MDPNSPADLTKLREAIRTSQNHLESFRTQYAERLAQYAGSGYGDNTENVDTPLNVFNLALRIYKRRLISGQPKVLVTARTESERGAAYELGLACDQLLREIDFLRTMKDVVQQALLSVGIVKVGVVPSDQAEQQGFLHDAEQPYCDAILLEDFAYDTAAKRWEEIDWCGNRYRIPLDEVLQNESYNQEAVEAISGGDGGRQDEDFRDGGNSDESVQHLGAGRDSLHEDIREYITVWDIWLPREGLFITIPDRGGPPLRVVEWEGPEGGPYHLLSLDPIPGNILPVAPAGHLAPLAKLLNRMMRKLGDQADRQKTIPLISRAAQQSGFGQTITDATDGEAISCDDPKQVNEMRLGGVDQASYAFFMGAREIFSWLGGNIDTIGGLASKADTLGQEKLLAESGNGLISELESSILQFTKKVVTDLAWYLYTDPFSVRQLVKKIEGTSIEVPSMWSPEKRSRPWFLFQFEVDPFSIHVRSPSERLQTVMQMFQTVIVPMIGPMTQAGMTFDIEGFWRLIVRYTGLTELSELIKAYGVGVTGEPKSDVVPKAPQTQREYIRRNVGSGANTLEGPGQQSLEMMMSQGSGEGMVA